MVLIAQRQPSSVYSSSYTLLDKSAVCKADAASLVSRAKRIFNVWRRAPPNVINTSGPLDYGKPLLRSRINGKGRKYHVVFMRC